MSGENRVLDKLKDLECPFTWELNENQIVEKHEEWIVSDDRTERDLLTVFVPEKDAKKTIEEFEEWRTREDENLFPILKFMRLIVTVYEHVLKDEFTESNENLKLAEKQWEEIKNDEDSESISVEVLENIYNGTKCHLEAKINNFDKVEEILKMINEIEYPKNLKARSTLNGCKGLAWSKYNALCKRGTGKAIDFAKLSIKDNPKFYGWHFILGKHLRSQRRCPFLYFDSCREEIQAFENAYKLCPKAIYEIHFAESLLDVTDEPINYKPLKIFKKIFFTKPESTSIQLRLALGFMKFSKFELAKYCLNFVKKRSPEDPMYLQFRKLCQEGSARYIAICNWWEIKRVYEGYA